MRQSPECLDSGHISVRLRELVHMLFLPIIRRHKGSHRLDLLSSARSVYHQGLKIVSSILCKLDQTFWSVSIGYAADSWACCSNISSISADTFMNPRCTLSLCVFWWCLTLYGKSVLFSISEELPFTQDILHYLPTNYASSVFVIQSQFLLVGEAPKSPWTSPAEMAARSFEH